MRRSPTGRARLAVLIYCIALGLALASTAAIGVHVAAARDTDAPTIDARQSDAHESDWRESDAEFCLLLESDRVEDAWSVVDDLSTRGCWGFELHGEGVVVVVAPRGALASLRSTAGVRAAVTGPADENLLASASPAARARLEEWNYHLAALDRAKSEPESDPALEGASLAHGGCVVLPTLSGLLPAEPAIGKVADGSDLPRVAKYNRAWGATDVQTSEFLFGRITVAIVTPHLAADRWTREELLAAHESVRQAMSYWKAQGTKGIGVHLEYVYLDSVTTSLSPLTSTTDSRWVEPLMLAIRARLGIPAPPRKAGKTPEPIYTEPYIVANHLRTVNKTDWAIMMIIGHGDNFSNAPGLSAYALLGGPYLVSPHKPARWKLSDLLIHEAGHLFFALDEYCCGGTSSPCSAVSGYLRIPNRNSLNRDSGCIPNSAACAMATPGTRACIYSKGMMGVWDSDGDGIMDLFDTQALVYITGRDGLPALDSLGNRAYSDTVTTLTPRYVGYARENPRQNLVTGAGIGAGVDAFDDAGAGASLDAVGLPGASALLPNRAGVTMNTIKSAEYRIDDGPWYLIRPDSSAYDAAVEDFRVTPYGLSGGTHIVEFRATNSVGNTTEARATTKQRLVVHAVAIEGPALTNGLDGGITVDWYVRGESWDTVGRLYRSSGAGPETLLVTLPQPDNGHLTYRDASVRPGSAYSYRIESNAFGKTYSGSAEAVASVPLSGSTDRLSFATPNPFRDETFLSFLAPEGLIAPPRPADDGRKPGLPPFLPPSAPRADLGAGGEFAAAQERLPVTIRVAVYDAAGRHVRTLVGGALTGAKLYTLRWDGTDDAGNPLPGGVYFSRFESGSFVDTGKLVLVR